MSNPILILSSFNFHFPFYCNERGICLSTPSIAALSPEITELLPHHNGQVQTADDTDFNRFSVAHSHAHWLNMYVFVLYYWETPQADLPHKKEQM